MARDTKDALLEASLRLFVRKGVAATTTRDIAAAAGVAEGTIYRHFVSKEALAEELFLSNYLPYARRLREAIRGQAEPMDQVAAMLRDFCAEHDRNPDLMHFLLIAQHGQLAKVPAGSDTPVAVLRSVIEAGVASGRFRRIDSALATYLVLGLLLEPSKAMAESGLRGPMRRHAQEIAEAARRVLSP